MGVLSFPDPLGIADVRAIGVAGVDGLPENEHLLLASLAWVGDLIHRALNAKLSWISSCLLIASKVFI